MTRHVSVRFSRIKHRLEGSWSVNSRTDVQTYPAQSALLAPLEVRREQSRFGDADGVRSGRSLKMEWRSHSSRWWIVQPEIGHAPDWYSVLLVPPEAPRIRVFLQDDPNEQPEAVTRGFQVVPACIRVCRLPRCPGPVLPGHPSRRVNFACVDHAAKLVSRSQRTARRSGATATVRTSRDVGCCRRSFANRPNRAPLKPPGCQSGKTLYQTNGHDPGCSRTPGVMMYRTRAGRCRRVLPVELPVRHDQGASGFVDAQQAILKRLRSGQTHMWEDIVSGR